MMKKLKLFLLLFTFTTLIHLTTLNAQWFEKTNGLPTNWSSREVKAYDSLIATGPRKADSIYITTNGGNYWYSRPQPSYLHHFSIIGKDKIWGSSTQKIYATLDGGFNWQLQFYDTSQTKYINYLEMFDSLNGIAMGDAASPTKPALILKTTNGGEDWISQNDSCLIGIESSDDWVDFINSNVGYLNGFDRVGNFGKLYKTENGGKTWEIAIDSTGLIIPRLYDENLVLCGWQPYKFARTTNGGNSWEIFNIASNGRFIFLSFIPGNPSNVWTTFANDIFFTSDTGRTWTVDYTSPNYKFRGIEFSDSNNGWLIAQENYYIYKVFRTTNGGHGGIVSVNDNRSNTFISNFILEQNYPNPFNPNTTINYQIPEISFVTLKVYDLLGNEIATLVNEEKPIGTYEAEFDATDLPSGIYFYSMQVGNFIETKKMVLMK
jgi:photosystem II stability/assembly factor-like uncharacterized protein